MKLSAPQLALREIADPNIALSAQRYFKTGKGEYGEGDQFIGIRMGDIRRIAKKHKELPSSRVLNILRSPIHEDRMLALIMLVHLYAKGDEEQKQDVYKLYLANTKYINSWDLVDSSAYF